MVAEVVTLYDNNFRYIVGTLRVIADEIEQGKHGEVSDFCLVMKGDELDIFHGGDGDIGTASLLLNAAIYRFSRSIVGD